ncbi:hypothetical protein [Sphingobacterium sp.]|nr:hypothetical protein [Sphingobacterium sp.]
MAKFNFLNLDQNVRSIMLSEINTDIETDNLYFSDRLNDTGKENYTNFLIDSVKNSDEEEFEMLLDFATHFNPTSLRQGKIVKTPSNASTILCQSEFNRYYIRAVCVHAMANDINEVEIYRARESSWSRPGSEAKIGNKISAQDLLDDLRSSVGVEPKLMPEVNSGLSVKISL